MKDKIKSARRVYSFKSTRRAPAVLVYDNTKQGISPAVASAAASKALRQRCFWSDDRLCNWAFDFKVKGHWAELLFHNNGVPENIPDFNPIHINIYE